MKVQDPLSCCAEVSEDQEEITHSHATEASSPSCHRWQGGHISFIHDTYGIQGMGRQGQHFFSHPIIVGSPVPLKIWSSVVLRKAEWPAHSPVCYRWWGVGPLSWPLGQFSYLLQVARDKKYEEGHMSITHAAKWFATYCTSEFSLNILSTYFHVLQVNIHTFIFLWWYLDQYIIPFLIWFYLFYLKINFI